MRRKRILTLVLGVVVGLGLLPLTAGPASAAVTTSYDSSTNTVTINDDSDGHAFTITGFTGSPSGFEITGPTPIPLPTPAGSNCTQSNADMTLKCTTTDVSTLVINGNGGNDTVVYSQAAGPLVVAINGGIGNDTLTKGADNAVLTGGADNDTLNAGDGTLRSTDVGGPGDDTYNGGSGEDLFNAAAEPGADSYNGGPGVDTVTYAGLSVPVSVTATGVGDDGPAGERDTVLGIETVYGGGGADTLSGGPANESLFGAGGDDLIIGGAGNDVLSGESGNDDVRSRDGLAANDQSNCGDGADKLSLDEGDGFDISCETRTVPTAVTVPTKAKAKGKKATIPVACPATAATACEGQLALSVNGKTVGTATFRVVAGAAANVAVKLSKKARSTLAQKGKLKVTLTITASDGVGPLPGTTAKVTLKGKKKS